MTQQHRISLRKAAYTLAFIAILFFSSNESFSQTSYNIGANPVMILSGTSTLHNWKMSAHVFSATAEISLTSDNKLSSMSALTLTLPVNNLKSDHTSMDDNTYQALKADTYKDIVFKLTSAKITSSGNNKYKIAASGNLTIAGKTQPVIIKTSGVLNADGSLSCNGSLDLKMSNYDVVPPTFMLGTMSVGDAISLHFKLILIK